MYCKVLIFVLFLSFVNCFDIPCNQQSIDKLDENVMRIAVLGDPNRKYPGKDEVQNHCQQDNQMTDWGKEYTKKCLTKRDVETSRHVTNLLMFSMRKVSNKRCRTQNTRNTFIHAGKCGNAFKSDTEKCWKQYIIDTAKVNKAKEVQITNDKHLLPLICCAYHKFHDCCVDAWSQTNNAKPCDRKAVSELEAYMNESMYDIIQYLCGDYQESNDKCDNLLARYKDILNKTKIKDPPKSALSEANEIFDSIPPL